MKLSGNEMKSAGIDDCAGIVMETIPLVMGVFRAEMRKHRPADMTVPQFRTLIFLQCHAGASLSDVAEHMGLTLSTASKLVDGLFKRQFITRETSTGDRRRITLELTESGQTTLEWVHKEARKHMAEALAGLNADECQAVHQSLQTLRRVLIAKYSNEVSK